MERRSHNPYTFETWSRDIMLWSLFTTLRPHQQAAAVVHALAGTAREVVRDLGPVELTQGGTVGNPPQHLDPLSYLIHFLTVRFAPLQEETTLRAITDLQQFCRRPGEGTDALISRFQSTVHRARNRGGFEVPVQMLS